MTAMPLVIFNCASPLHNNVVYIPVQLTYAPKAYGDDTPRQAVKNLATHLNFQTYPC